MLRPLSGMIFLCLASLPAVDRPGFGQEKAGAGQQGGATGYVTVVPDLFATPRQISGGAPTRAPGFGVLLDVEPPAGKSPYIVAAYLEMRRGGEGGKWVVCPAKHDAYRSGLPPHGVRDELRLVGTGTAQLFIPYNAVQLPVPKGNDPEPISFRFQIRFFDNRGRPTVPLPEFDVKDVGPIDMELKRGQGVVRRLKYLPGGPKPYPFDVFEVKGKKVRRVHLQDGSGGT
jgi:hypothetical protein